MFAASCISVYAVGVSDIDTSKTGSISLTLAVTNDGTPVVGVGVTAYYVADLVLTEDGYDFDMSRDFAASGITVTDPEDDEAAANLFAHAQFNYVDGETRYSDAYGGVYFGGLKCGLYLVAETQAVAAFSGFSPFMVLIPYTIGDEIEYDINATPKIIIEHVFTPPPPPPPPSTTSVWTTEETETTTEEATTAVTASEPVTYPTVTTRSPYDDGMSPGSSGDRLMQTGQLNWPVPVLGSVGVLSLIVGIAVKLMGRKHGDDGE